MSILALQQAITFCRISHLPQIWYQITLLNQHFRTHKYFKPRGGKYSARKKRQMGAILVNCNFSKLSYCPPLLSGLMDNVFGELSGQNPKFNVMYEICICLYEYLHCTCNLKYIMKRFIIYKEWRQICNQLFYSLVLSLFNKLKFNQ